MKHRLIDDLDVFRALNKRPDLAAAVPGPAPEIMIRNRHVIDFTNWDVLNLRNHPAVRRTLQQTAEAQGLGRAAARLASGTDSLHLELENRLAQLVGCEAAILFSSRNQAVLSMIISLGHESDVMVYDEELRAPAADAAFLINASVDTCQLAQTATLAQLLEQFSGRNCFVVAESVSPFHGEQLDLIALTKLTAQHQALLLLDESYALGSLGEIGGGCAMEAGLSRNVCCLIGDLSLSLGIWGSFVAGSRAIIDLLVTRSKTFSTETAPAPILAATALAAIDLAELMPTARQQVREQAQTLRQGLRGLPGLHVYDGATPIVAIKFSKLSNARSFAGALLERGILAEVLPSNKLLSEQAVVRFIVTIAHNNQHICHCLEAAAVVASRYPKL